MINLRIQAILARSSKEKFNKLIIDATYGYDTLDTEKFDCKQFHFVLADTDPIYIAIAGDSNIDCYQQFEAIISDQQFYEKYVYQFLPNPKKEIYAYKKILGFEIENEGYQHTSLGPKYNSMIAHKWNKKIIKSVNGTLKLFMKRNQIRLLIKIMQMTQSESETEIEAEKETNSQTETELETKFVTLKDNECFDTSAQKPWIIRRKYEGFIPKFIKKKNLALCDRFLLIEEIAKLGNSTKMQQAQRILFVVKQKKIKNASNLELSQIVKYSKQFIDKKRTGQKCIKKQVKQNRKLLTEQEEKIVEWKRNRYRMKKIQTTPKQIREKIFRRWKITVSGYFHKYLVGRHIDKLVIKIATARQVQRMLLRAEDIQKHLTNLKISVKGKRA
ncbi:MAG: hypothetical protein EZS28_029666 [Streblomastix strix]|uniref:Uncharacterized protein n=1 Tax=Streblomastix strix TaxID=222440 RepID=A0A5J4UWJ2_9EUKA|nr:MAG: hypothetical protein EZS28_029666 [Streblomastix strix]